MVDDEELYLRPMVVPVPMYVLPAGAQGMLASSQRRPNMMCTGRVKPQRLKSNDGVDIAVFIEMDDGGGDVFLSGRVSPRLPRSGARIKFRLSLTRESRWVAQNGEWLYAGTSVATHFPGERRDGLRVEGVVSTRKLQSDCCWITVGDLNGGVYCLAKWCPRGLTPPLGARVSFELKKGKYGDWRVASPPGLVVLSEEEIVADEAALQAWHQHVATNPLVNQQLFFTVTTRDSESYVPVDDVYDPRLDPDVPQRVTWGSERSRSGHSFHSPPSSPTRGFVDDDKPRPASQPVCPDEWAQYLTTQQKQRPMSHDSSNSSTLSTASPHYEKPRLRRAASSGFGDDPRVLRPPPPVEVGSPQSVIEAPAAPFLPKPPGWEDAFVGSVFVNSSPPSSDDVIGECVQVNDTLASTSSWEERQRISHPLELGESSSASRTTGALLGSGAFDDEDEGDGKSDAGPSPPEPPRLRSNATRLPTTNRRVNSKIVVRHLVRCLRLTAYLGGRSPSWRRHANVHSQPSRLRLLCATLCER